MVNKHLKKIKQIGGSSQLFYDDNLYDKLSYDNKLKSIPKSTPLSFDNTMSKGTDILEYDDKLPKYSQSAGLRDIVNNIKNKLNKSSHFNKVKNIHSNVSDKIQAILNKHSLLILFIGLLITYILFTIINSKWFVSLRYNKRLNKLIDRINVKPVLLCSANSLAASEYNYIQTPDGRKDTPKKLCNFYVASSNCTCIIGGENGWVSTEALTKTIEAGARLLDFDIFNSTWGEYAEPVVAVGSEKGPIITSKNTVKFEEIAQLILNYAFSSNHVNNNTDPLFLNFNIKVDKNFYTLNKLADIIYKHFEDFLLPKKYSYQRQIIGQISLDELSNKVIIFADKDFENSKFAELVNSSSQKNFMRINNFNKDVKGSYDHTELINFNKRWVTLCKPDSSSENYDPFIAWIYGCQFACLNYSVDEHMDEYIDKFKESSFTFKPWKLRWKPITINKPKPQDKRLSFKTISAGNAFYNAKI